MDIKKIPTCELVEELEMREGVETIKQGPEGTDRIIAKDPGEDDYDQEKKGPCVILRIID